MTAIAPESDRRYASVAALAADLDRHAAGQPVVARAPGAAYVLSKFVRRHRGLVVAAVVAVLALVAGAAGLAAGAAKARRQAESTGRVNSLLREMLVRLEPTSARGFAQSLLSQLDYAKGELEKGLLRDDPAIEIDLRMALGRVYGALGYAGWARNEFSIAVAMAREHYPPRDARLVQMLRWLGWADRNCAQLGDAEAHLREAVELAGALGGLDDDRCTALNDLGLTLTALARYDDADQALEEALAHWRAIGKSESQGAAGVQAAIALNRLARGDAQAAEPSARIALALCQKLCPEADPRQAIALDTLARVLQAEGKLDEAEPLLERSLAIRRGLFDPKSPVIAWSLSLLAGVRVAAGNPSGAIPLLEEALAIRKIHYEPDSQVRVQALLELGLALLEAGERDAALPHLTEAVTIADQKGYPDEPRLARARSELAR
jgi:tetratricopeptide (TPR) repeat protein